MKATGTGDEERGEGSRSGARPTPYPTAGYVVITALAIVLVISALPHRYPDGVHMATESIRVYAAMAIVDTGQLCVNPVFDRYYPGWEAAGFLPNIDAAVRDGCYLLDKAPLMSWLAVPITALMSLAGYPGQYPVLTLLLVLALVTLPALLLLLALRRRILDHGLVSAPALDTSLLLLLLASPFLANMGLFLSHALAGVVLLVGLACALGHPAVGDSDASRNARLPMAGGFLLGCTVLLEYPSAFFVVAAGLALLVDRRARWRLPWFVLGGLAPLAALLAWNTAAFGGPLELSYAYKAHTPHQEIIAEGFFGLSTLRPEVLFGLTLGSSRGLFFFAPWALLGLWGLVVAARDRSMALRWRVGLPLVVIGYFLLIGSFTDWEAGQVSVGPRHLVVLLPLLALLTAVTIDRLDPPDRHRALLPAFLAATGLLGLMMNVTAANVFPHLPDSLANPFFEVIVPVLMEAGPSSTLLAPLLPPWTGLLLQLLLALSLLGASLVALCRHLEVRALPVALLTSLLTVALLALAVSPATTDPRGELRVLHHRMQIHDLRGHQDLASDYRRLLEVRRAARQRGGQDPQRTR